MAARLGFPVSETNQIILLGCDSNKQLLSTLWNGSAFVDDPAILLDPIINAEESMPFDLGETGY